VSFYWLVSWRVVLPSVFRSLASFAVWFGLVGFVWLLLGYCWLVVCSVGWFCQFAVSVGLLVFGCSFSPRLVVAACHCRLLARWFCLAAIALLSGLPLLSLVVIVIGFSPVAWFVIVGFVVSVCLVAFHCFVGHSLLSHCFTWLVGCRLLVIGLLLLVISLLVSFRSVCHYCLVVILSVCVIVIRLLLFVSLLGWLVSSVWLSLVGFIVAGRFGFIAGSVWFACSACHWLSLSACSSVVARLVGWLSLAHCFGRLSLVGCSLCLVWFRLSLPLWLFGLLRQLVVVIARFGCWLVSLVCSVACRLPVVGWLSLVIVIVVTVIGCHFVGSSSLSLVRLVWLVVVSLVIASLVVICSVVGCRSVAFVSFVTRCCHCHCLLVVARLPVVFITVACCSSLLGCCWLLFAGCRCRNKHQRSTSIQ
jgi:hypothetical protein